MECHCDREVSEKLFKVQVFTGKIWGSEVMYGLVVSFPRTADRNTLSFLLMFTGNRPCSSVTAPSLLPVKFQQLYRVGFLDSSSGFEKLL